jgi:glycosyltransferase involved in cell wall biosynthesis
VKVSCITVTYNRPPRHQSLVEEAIESFLRQDYPQKELIVLNDCPGQRLACAAPGVTVVNWPRRFRSLGEKRNAAAALADGYALLPWDDDDIMLPWRISTSVRRLGGADYFNPSRYWFIDSAGLHRDHGRALAHGCSIFTRSAFDRIGGYPPINVGEDMEFDHALRRTPGVTVAAADLPADDWYYLYRWGVSPVHLSSHGPGDGWYEEIGRRPVEPGLYVLRPHWRDNYVARTKAALHRPAQGH